MHLGWKQNTKAKGTYLKSIYSKFAIWFPRNQDFDTYPCDVNQNPTIRSSAFLTGGSTASLRTRRLQILQLRLASRPRCSSLRPEGSGEHPNEMVDMGKIKRLCLQTWNVNIMIRLEFWKCQILSSTNVCSETVGSGGVFLLQF